MRYSFAYWLSKGKEVVLLSNEHGVFVTLGASNHTANPRAENDFYATDPRAIELLLDIESFSDKIWECACGEGHLSKVLEAKGYDVISTDLINRGFGTGGRTSFHLLRYLTEI